MEELSQQAQECLNIWQKEIDDTGAASLLGEGRVAQELLKAGYVEKSPFGGAYEAKTCYKCVKIKNDLVEDERCGMVCSECIKQ